MTTGFRNRSNDGQLLQLDNSYANMAMYQKGTATMSAISAGYFVADVDIPTPHPATAVAVIGNHPGIAVGVLQMRKLGNFMRVRFCASPRATNGRTLTWYSFVPASVANGVGNIGLKLRDSANRTVSYDSTLRYMKIVGAIDADGGPTTSYFAPPYPGQFAALISAPYVAAGVTFTSNGNTYTRTAWIDSAGVHISNGGVQGVTGPILYEFDRESGAGISSNSRRGNTEFPIVDVTGF